MLQILKNILTLCCVGSLSSNLWFLAEAISSVLNKTEIIRFEEKSGFNFIFMFSISQHLTVYAALQSHEPELIKCNKTANFALSGLENFILPIKVINLSHLITPRSAICSFCKWLKPLTTVVSCAEFYCAVLNKPADLSVWRRYQIKKLARSLLWHFPGHLEVIFLISPWLVYQDKGRSSMPPRFPWFRSFPLLQVRKNKWVDFLEFASSQCL